ARWRSPPLARTRSATASRASGHSERRAGEWKRLTGTSEIEKRRGNGPGVSGFISSRSPVLVPLPTPPRQPDPQGDLDGLHENPGDEPPDRSGGAIQPPFLQHHLQSAAIFPLPREHILS